jgi:hypothetical protein
VGDGGGKRREGEGRLVGRNAAKSGGSRANGSPSRVPMLPRKNVGSVGTRRVSCVRRLLEKRRVGGRMLGNDAGELGRGVIFGVEVLDVPA